MSTRAGTLVPLCGFLLLLGLAVYGERSAASRSVAQLHGRATALCRAVEAGDAETALRFVRPSSGGWRFEQREAIAALVARYRGALFRVLAIDVSEALGESLVQWERLEALPRRGVRPGALRGAVQGRLSWRRADGQWWLDV